MVIYNGIEVDYDAAVKTARAIMTAMDEKIPPFNKKFLFPDATVPEGITPGSKDHARYQFYSVSLDSMVQAEDLYRKMRKISKASGGFKELGKRQEFEIQRMLTPYFGEGILHGTVMGDPVKTLSENSKKLQEECHDNPIELKRDTVMETLENISKYRQFRVFGKAALLLKNYVKFGIWDFPESEVAIKIDRHVMRMSLGCGIVPAKQYTKQVDDSKPLSKALQKAKEKFLRFGYFTEDDFKEGRVRAVRRDKLVDPLGLINLDVTRNTGISGIDLDDGYWAIGAYSCRKNNAEYCKVSCPVQCETRPPSDNNAIWFFVDVDKRKNLEQMTMFGF